MTFRPVSITHETLAGRYELLDLIGQGGQALVFRARDTRTNRDVAVKMLGKSASNDPRWVERMAREQQAMVALAGTDAVGFIDVCTSRSGALCLVMEFLDGTDLEAHLEQREKNGGRLPVEEIMRLMSPIVETLEKAHSVGIIHRDLKPSNIFIARSGDGTRARLLDFGFARTQASKQITGTGMILGSPSYIAPEMWLPRPQAPDRRVDVYALGVILFRMLAGELPFKGNTLQEKFIAITTSERPSLHALRPELPKNVDIWVERALAIDTADRFPSARASFGELAWALGLGPHPSSQKESTPPSTDLKRVREWLEAPFSALPNTLSAAFNWAAGALGRLKRLAMAVPGFGPARREDEVLALPPAAPTFEAAPDGSSKVFALDESGMRPAIEFVAPGLVGANEVEPVAAEPEPPPSLGQQVPIAVEDEPEPPPRSQDRSTLERRQVARGKGADAGPPAPLSVNPTANTVVDTGPPPKVTTPTAYDVTLDDRDAVAARTETERETLLAASPGKKARSTKSEETQAAPAKRRRREQGAASRPVPAAKRGKKEAANEASAPAARAVRTKKPVTKRDAKKKASSARTDVKSTQLQTTKKPSRTTPKKAAAQRSAQGSTRTASLAKKKSKKKPVQRDRE